MKIIISMIFMGVSLLCFAGGTHIVVNSTYDALTYDELMSISMLERRVYEKNADHLNNLKIRILEVIPQLQNKEFVDRLNYVYKQLSAVNSRNILGATQFLNAAEDDLNKIISEYNVWVNQSNSTSSKTYSSATTFNNSPVLMLIYGGQNHDVFLGCLNCNDSDKNSIWNEFGTYGNSFNSSSIWNEFGTYGNNYNSYSPWNSNSSKPPVVVDKEGNFYGYLTVNENKSQRAEFELALIIYKYHELIRKDVGEWYNIIFE